MDAGIGYLLFVLSVHADGSPPGRLLEEWVRHDVAILGSRAQISVTPPKVDHHESLTAKMSFSVIAFS